MLEAVDNSLPAEGRSIKKKQNHPLVPQDSLNYASITGADEKQNGDYTLSLSSLQASYEPSR